AGELGEAVKQLPHGGALAVELAEVTEGQQRLLGEVEVDELENGAADAEAGARGEPGLADPEVARQHPGGAVEVADDEGAALREELEVEVADAGVAEDEVAQLAAAAAQRSTGGLE